MNIRNVSIIGCLFLIPIIKTDNTSFEQFAQDNPELLQGVQNAHEEWDQSPEAKAMRSAYDLIDICAAKNNERILDGCEHLYIQFCELRKKAENTSQYKKYREKLAQAGNQYKESLKIKK